MNKLRIDNIFSLIVILYPLSPINSTNLFPLVSLPGIICLVILQCVNTRINRSKVSWCTGHDHVHQLPIQLNSNKISTGGSRIL